MNLFNTKEVIIILNCLNTLDNKPITIKEIKTKTQIKDTRNIIQALQVNNLIEKSRQNKINYFKINYEKTKEFLLQEFKRNNLVSIKQEQNIKSKKMQEKIRKAVFLGLRTRRYLQYVIDYEISECYLAKGDEK
jgi:hypothetical protein